jgi:geranylgeranyl diphosphate synthase type I
MTKTSNQEETTNQLLKILDDRGKRALELARKTVLEEKTESKQVHEALNYFMTEYWYDVTRPALLSLACEAVGGDPELTTPIAISMTLISGGIDIHDDIIDQSKEKENKPTVYGKFGKDIALLVGDALMFKGFAMLYKSSEKGLCPEKIATISDIIKKTFFELGDAEALELQFRGREDVTPEEYLYVIRKKSADVEAHTRISAIIGGASAEEIDALGEYGRLLGMLVILRDEMIDMLDPKETIHRIKKEHLSMAIIYALQNNEFKPAISSLLQKTTTIRDAEKLSLLVDKAGGYSQTHEYMAKLVSTAKDKIDKAKVCNKHLALLVYGMLLPDWRSYLTPVVSNR